MSSKNKPAALPAALPLILTRTFNAPRALVWQAWTDPAHLAQWWGPHGFTNPRCEIDVRPGGAIHIDMRAPDGTVYPMPGTFQEVLAPARLSFTSGAQGKDGQLLFEFLTIVTFIEKKGRTTMTLDSRLTMSTPAAAPYLGGHKVGWSQSLERLIKHVGQMAAPVVIERIFAAPVAQVWQALTSKTAMKEWSFDLKDFKPQVGFKFDIDKTREGIRFLHRCQITKVIPGKKLAYTWRYEGFEGDSLVTFELFAAGRKTKLRLTHAGLETFPPIPPLARENFIKGWTMIIGTNLKKFVETDTTDREIVISRVFDAPRELVWNAWTDPRQIAQWWGPTGFTTTIEKMDVRPGGVWKHVMHGPDGTDYSNKSVFTEVVKPERIVFSHSGGKKGAKVMNFEMRWIFEEQGKKTKLTIHQIYKTAADCNNIAKKYGAVEGGKQTLARLAAHLAKKKIKSA
jgi:uncharacterized protein YndB with AHSA1/START domain